MCRDMGNTFSIADNHRETGELWAGKRVTGCQSDENLCVLRKQKTAYEILSGLVGSEMCIRDSLKTANDDIRKFIKSATPAKAAKY